jgi:hydroxymethylpyrimidine/phosphomethylpyrimidine kinase
LGKIVVTIGASDSSGRGGIQADLRLFQALGVQGAAAVTAVGARGAGPIRRQVKLPARIIEAQLDAVTRELDVGAVKVGALSSWQMVETIAARLRRRRPPNVVLQAGIFDSDGARVLGARGVSGLRRSLLPQVRVLVLSPAETGLLAEMPVASVSEAKEAAARLRVQGVEAVLIVGQSEAALWLARDRGGREFECMARHLGMGASSLLSAIVAARLALGDEVEEAVSFAAGFSDAELPNIARPTDI